MMIDLRRTYNKKKRCVHRLLYCIISGRIIFLFFFFNDTATTEIYTLSLHDALPISQGFQPGRQEIKHARLVRIQLRRLLEDRKSTRLNSSHGYISYAVFCLKKKNENQREPSITDFKT